MKLFLARDDPGGTMATIATEDSPWFREHRTEQYVEVDALPLTQLMEQYQVPQRFGMLLVDAEGMDLEVLRATDFIRFRPRLIVTEDYESKNAEKFAFLGSVGYRFVVRRGCNTFGVER